MYVYNILIIKGGSCGLYVASVASVPLMAGPKTNKSLCNIIEIISDFLLFQVEITHRIAWVRTSRDGGTCTQATVNAQTLLLSGGLLTCQSGCTGRIGNFSYYCTDFSVTDNWSAGERTYTYNFTESSFEAT